MDDTKRDVPAQPDLIVFGELVVNVFEPKVYFKGKEFHATPFEYEVLRYLALRSAPAPARQLLDHIAVRGQRQSLPAALSSAIANLRNKLGRDGPMYLPPRTRGYVLRNPKTAG